MKIERHLDWGKSSQIYIESGDFCIYIEEKEIEISCDISCGYYGSAAASIIVPTAVIKDLIDELLNQTTNGNTNYKRANI